MSTGFSQVCRDAVAASDSDAAAYLLQNRRIRPEYYGPLLGNVSTFAMKGRKMRNRALAAIWPLRSAIIHARRAVIEERSRLYVIDKESLEPITDMMEQQASDVADPPGRATVFAEDVAGSSSTNPYRMNPLADMSLDTDNPLAQQILMDEAKDQPSGSPGAGIANDLSDEDNDDDTRIDSGLADAAAQIAEVTAMANGAMGQGCVLDAAKLSRALARMSASLAAAASDEPWTMVIQNDQVRT